MGQPSPKATSGQSQLNPTLAVLRDRLWQAALALTRSREDADDLTQQTLAVVLTRRPVSIHHMGYVRKTMFRLWLDEQRSMRRRLRRVARIALTLGAGRRDPDRLSDGELHERVQRAIDALPPQQHAVVVLRLIEGLDYSEIASTLGCSVGTIRANLHLARGSVRRMMGEPS